MSKFRIFLAIVLAIVLLAIAYVLNVPRKSTDTPDQSTTQTQPNSPANTPPKNDVTQGGNPAEDATPDPSGTGGNTILSQ